MRFPREEDFAELTRGRTYSEGIRWRLFIDPTGELPGKQVLVTTDHSWTLLSGPNFRRLVERIMRQLDD